MSYKTRPYFPLTGRVPNFFRSYTVEGGTVSLNRIFSSESVKQASASTSLRQGIIQKILGTGDVEVYENGTLRFTFKRAINAKDLKTAIEGGHSDLTSTTEAATPQQTPVRFSNKELEDFEVVIPFIPRGLYGYVYSTKGVDIKCLVSDGQDIQKGQSVVRLSNENDYSRPLVKYSPDKGEYTMDIARHFFGIKKRRQQNTTQIVAPISGRVRLYEEYPFIRDIIWEKGKKIPLTASFMTIQPVKGALEQTPVDRLAYEAFRNLIFYYQNGTDDNGQPLYGFHPDHDAQYAPQDIALLEDYICPTIPIQATRSGRKAALGFSSPSGMD